METKILDFSEIDWSDPLVEFGPIHEENGVYFFTASRFIKNPNPANGLGAGHTQVIGNFEVPFPLALYVAEMSLYASNQAIRMQQIKLSALMGNDKSNPVDSILSDFQTPYNKLIKLRNELSK